MEVMVKDTENTKTVFDNKEQMLYDLLFSNKPVILVNLDEFCQFNNREGFKDEIRYIIKLGGVKILDDRIVHTNESVLWKLELKRI